MSFLLDSMAECFLYTLNRVSELSTFIKHITMYFGVYRLTVLLTGAIYPKHKDLVIWLSAQRSVAE